MAAVLVGTSLPPNLETVRELVAPDATYVSLSYDTPT